MIERGAGVGIGRKRLVKHGERGFDVEQVLSNQARPIDVDDRPHHAMDGVRHEMARADRANLPVTDDTIRVNLHQDGFAKQCARRTGIVGAARCLALNPDCQVGHEHFNSVNSQG